MPDEPAIPASELFERTLARLADRRRPVSTYRLQLNHGFRFRDAAALVPYLRALGVSDLYLSPFFAAMPGSLHGYDVVDHQALNPELGGEADLEALETALEHAGLGVLLDVVPNHMGIGFQNAHWMAVLESGQSSPSARFFDIDWQPVKDELLGKLLLPILGDQYGIVLERGELRLAFDGESFEVRYFEQRLPIDPRSYPLVLGRRREALLARLGERREELEDFDSLVSAFGKLPSTTETDPERCAERAREKEVQKRRLARLCERSPEVLAFVTESVVELNGRPGEARSFDGLDELLNAQVYRLAHWRVAGEEINYRRFFDINQLAAIRAEDPVVFEETHRRIFERLARGNVTGLRIDHPDGLYDPTEYFRRIQVGHALLQARQVARELGLSDEAFAAVEPELVRRLAAEIGVDPSTSQFRPLYVVAEKILTGRERVPTSWAIHGTTGYDFLNALQGLFVAQEGEGAFTRAYERAIGRPIDFEELGYQAKKLILGSTMASEINVLARRLNRLSEHDRRTRDFTLRSLTRALVELLACFPVYRTYLREGEEVIDARDQRYVHWAVERAKRRDPTANASIYDFIESQLLLHGAHDLPATERADRLAFTLRLQQLTGPVMAKGVEDTAFYVYDRLVALNEVGGEPERFGLSPQSFHSQNRERAQSFPHALLASSTHDTKRSEDVRARLCGLSELPDEWERHLERWMTLHRSLKVTLPDGRLAPDAHDELLLYQTLLGIWPLGELSEATWEALRQRIGAYALKAAREAKLCTSWVNPDLAYEKALVDFVRCLLPERPPPLQTNPFLEDFLPLEERLARAGLFTSLSQLVLKVASPGVPDFYQGNELWDLSLVDPDNRRPVDFRLRERLLNELRERGADRPSRRLRLVRELLVGPTDPRLKLYVTYVALRERGAKGSPLQRGDYQPLVALGPNADRLVAFARTRGEQTVVAVAPRLWVGILDDAGELRRAKESWAETVLALPERLAATAGEERFTGASIPVRRIEGRPTVRVSELLVDFPVALLAFGET
ncbi:MAG: malto-oligosyltrehalose synthase [Deltaproteobacteria bacterium]